MYAQSSTDNSMFVVLNQFSELTLHDKDLSTTEAAGTDIDSILPPKPEKGTLFCFRACCLLFDVRSSGTILEVKEATQAKENSC